MQPPPFLAGITVRMDKLQALAPNLVPVLSTSPVAVTVRDETCFYLIGPAMLESLLAGTTPVIHDLLEPPKGMVELARQEPLFHQVAEKLLVVETQRVTRGDYSPESLNILRNRLKLHVLPALGRRLPCQGYKLKVEISG